MVVESKDPATAHPSSPQATPLEHSDPLRLALGDLTEVFAVYPYRAGMPACPHCVGDDDLRALGRRPPLIPSTVFDRYADKALITWGSTPDFKRLLPELFARLTAGQLGCPAVTVTARLRRARWAEWPAAEPPAVRRVLRAWWQRAFDAPPRPGHAPATVRLAAVAAAEDDLTPYLDLWLDRLESPGAPSARLAALLHLSALLAPLAEAGPRGLAHRLAFAPRPVVGQVVHWARQPAVVQRLAHANEALAGTEHDALVRQARAGLLRLRAEG